MGDAVRRLTVRRPGGPGLADLAGRRRHVAFVVGGLNALIIFNFPFNPPFPTIGEPPPAVLGGPCVCGCVLPA